MTKTQLYNIWQFVLDIPQYQRILYLLGVHEKSLDQMAIWDEEEIMAIKEAEEDYRKEEFKTQKQIREFKNEIDPNCKMRLKYLKERKEFLEDYIMKAKKHNKEMKDKFYHPIKSLEWLRMLIMELWNLPEYEKELRKILFEIRLKENKDLIQEGQITEEMIARAKDYPFGNLVEIPKNGFISCPYHAEKTPSFSFNRKHNYFHCFACNKTTDTIQFVIDQYNKSFIEAVKYLSNL